ncbi:hypothetical protein [Flavobacterium sp. LC2016-23]|nr:hypothetical protein [Flavobacterium sp. LC2016-23]
MAQSQLRKVVLVLFYGWYKLVGGNCKTEHKMISKMNILIFGQ